MQFDGAESVIVTTGLLGAVIPTHVMARPELWTGVRLEEIERRILQIEENIRALSEVVQP